jgi:hypothetical protein
MKLRILLMGLVVSTASLFAQNKLVGELKKNYDMTKDFVTRAAEKMPEANYSFKPTPEVRTFGELVGHVIEAHGFICALGNPPKPAAKATSKADIVKALKDSYAVCDAAFNGLTDAKATTSTVKMMGQDQTVLSSLWGNVMHDNEVYGTMVAYLRMKGIVPPSSEGGPMGGKKEDKKK